MEQKLRREINAKQSLKDLLTELNAGNLLDQQNLEALKASICYTCFLDFELRQKVMLNTLNMLRIFRIFKFRRSFDIAPLAPLLQ